jgi:hypothetical protein
VKLRIIVLMLCGVAGAGASFAFADGGGHGRDGNCRHAVLFGTVSAPQSFTVTVSRSWRHSNLTRGQTVNVAVGSSGQTIRLSGEGCVGTDGTVTVREGVLHVVRPHGGDGGQTTTAGNATTTTNGDQPPTTTNGDHPPTTTTSNDAPTTTNGDTTTSTNPR